MQNFLTYLLPAILLLLSCSDDDMSFDPLNVNSWVGQYEIDTIGSEPVTCDEEFLNGEVITISSDGTYSVVSICNGDTVNEGTYTFSLGVFSLFVSTRIQDPEDLPEFEMQIFDDQAGRITIYRCSRGADSCIIRKGSRLN